MEEQLFRKSIEAWYECHRRELPWRGISDPYRIWVSEIILQQTRIDQGRDYYLRFLDLFPDVFTLAHADEDEVLKAWEGLGYYSRARNLHAAAQSIAADGHFPSSYSEVRALKGVGDYTAAAICSFAFSLPVATVDGNVYRVLSRIFAVDLPIDTTAGKHYFQSLADRLLDREHPADYNQALMDFGALQCTPANPTCDECPLQAECQARQNHLVDLLPVKSHKMQQKHRYFSYFFILHNDSLLIHRRAANDIWKGLYEPFLIETDKADFGQTFHHPFIDDAMKTGKASLSVLRQNVKHVLTHRIIHADFYSLQLQNDTEHLCENLPKDYFFAPLDKLDNYAFPVLIDLSLIN
jgi:A/G-specific adenine glycosylase